jgi:hypothetical protein
MISGISVTIGFVLNIQKYIGIITRNSLSKLTDYMVSQALGPNTNAHPAQPITVNNEEITYFSSIKLKNQNNICFKKLHFSSHPLS